MSTVYTMPTRSCNERSLELVVYAQPGALTHRAATALRPGRPLCGWRGVRPELRRKALVFVGEQGAVGTEPAGGRRVLNLSVPSVYVR
jgi:hypothetical protein